RPRAYNATSPSAKYRDEAISPYATDAIDPVPRTRRNPWKRRGIQRGGGRDKDPPTPPPPPNTPHPHPAPPLRRPPRLPPPRGPAAGGAPRGAEDDQLGVSILRLACDRHTRAARAKQSRGGGDAVRLDERLRVVERLVRPAVAAG